MSPPPESALGSILQGGDSIGFYQAMQGGKIEIVEKLVYKQIKPEVVYIQSIKNDTLLIKELEKLDLMQSVQRFNNGDMIIFTYNQYGKLLKKLLIENTGTAFTLTSQNGGVFIKSRLWNWNGLYFQSQLKVPLNNNYLKETYLENGLFTGINFNNIIDLNIGISYNKLENLKGILETKIKIKK